MSRDPFAFLQTESKDRILLLLLQALVRRAPNSEVELDLAELTSLADGDSLFKYPSDKGDKLVLRFARRGAEAYFLSEDASSTPTPRKTSRAIQPLDTQSPAPPARHAVHDDLDLALREEEMATRAERTQRERLNQSRAEAGAMPWRTRPPS